MPRGPSRRPNRRPPKKPPKRKTKRKGVKPLEGERQGLRPEELRKAMQDQKSDIQKFIDLLSLGMGISKANIAEREILRDKLGKRLDELEKARHERQLTVPENEMLAELRKLFKKK